MISTYIFVPAFIAAFVLGWLAREQVQHYRNRRIARSVKRAVDIARSRKKPEDMMEYQNRQRTADNKDNPARSRQGRVRFVRRSRPR